MDAAEDRSARPISPNYPGNDLDKCFADASALFDTYLDRATFTEGEVGSIWKVKSGTGAFRRRFAAVKHFRLVEPTEGRYRISPLYISLYRAEKDSIEFKRAAFDAITGVSVFKDILNALGDRLPAHAALVKRLVLDHRFSQGGAERAAQVLEDSLSFAGLRDSSGNLLPIRDEATSPPDHPSGNKERSAVHEGMPNDPIRSTNHTGSSSPSPQSDRRQIDIPLPPRPGPDGTPTPRSITVLYPHDLSAEESRKAGSVLQMMLEAVALMEISAPVTPQAVPGPPAAPAATPLGL